jgi:hypothetical protein
MAPFFKLSGFDRFAMLVGMVSQYRYREIVDANDPKWLAGLKRWIDKGKQVAVVHITPSQIRDCYAYA